MGGVWFLMATLWSGLPAVRVIAKTANKRDRRSAALRSGGNDWQFFRSSCALGPVQLCGRVRPGLPDLDTAYSPLDSAARTPKGGACCERRRTQSRAIPVLGGRYHSIHSCAIL